ncbi:MAG TPA: PQQ-binding-like beta-propeller repeat protein [Gemmataceae bacterium]|nr:PQQ-binding-like beta-propeller repeat protein [Gemmataceae bacterium]
MKCISSLIYVVTSFWILSLAAGCKERQAVFAQQPQRADPAPTTQGPADWPFFRGNALQDGQSPEVLPDHLEVLWKVTTGKQGIEGTAAIVDGVVYLGSFDKNIYAFDLKTGDVKWKFPAGPFKGSAAVRNGKVYIGDEDGKFFCIQAENGRKLWQFDTDSQFSAGASFAGERILIGCEDENLYCLDDSGKKLWQFNVPGGPVLASPAVVQGQTFLAGCDSKLHMIDVKTGQESAAVDIEGQTGCTPAVRGEVLYLGTQSNQVLAIDTKKKEVAWTFEPPSRQQPFNASAAVTDKFVIIGNQNKRLYALDRHTGKQAWIFVTEGQVDSSAVISGQRVYVGSMDGNLYVIDLNKGTEIQKIDLGSPIVASPAVSNSRLVIGTTNGAVYCLGKK